MNVTINFSLPIEINAWVYRNGGPIVAKTADLHERVAAEVQAHAENVIRDLYEDMGWIVETADA